MMEDDECNPVRLYIKNRIVEIERSVKEFLGEKRFLKMRKLCLDSIGLDLHKIRIARIPKPTISASQIYRQNNS